MDNAIATPELIEAICKFLSQNGRYHEGIFRISPSRNSLAALRERLREEGCHFLISDMKKSDGVDPHTVASLLKLLLSEFSEPLLRCLTTSNVGNLDDAAVDSEIQHGFLSLSPDKRKSAEAVLNMLHELQAFSSVTRMGPSQLAVVFAPTLFGCPDTPESLSRFHKITLLMERLIMNPIIEHSLIEKRLDIENPIVSGSWLAVIRSVIRERLFSCSSDVCTDLNHFPQQSHVNVQASDNSVFSQSNKADQLNSRANVVPVTLVQPPTYNAAEHVSVASFPDISPAALSSRSVQLTRIAEALCERFGISADKKARHSVSPVEEKVALQRALLELEGSFGRPADKTERQIVRPLYERYRELKRLAANFGPARNYRHHHHHHPEQRRHKFCSESNVVDNIDTVDVRWATASSNRLAQSEAFKLEKDYNAEPVGSQLAVNSEHRMNSGSEKRRPKESRAAGRNDLVPVELISPTTAGEQPGIGEIKPQIALNSSS